MKFTAVYKRAPKEYIGFVQELPGANTQGKTLEETGANPQEAIEMTLEANRILAEESILKMPCTYRPTEALNRGSSAVFNLCNLRNPPRFYRDVPLNLRFRQLSPAPINPR